MNNVSAIDSIGRMLTVFAMALWFYRDARGRDFSWVMWMIMPVTLFFFGRFIWILPAILMLTIYLGVRPRGQLIPCPHCRKRVHEELAFCGFCRRSVKRECIKCHRTVPWESVSCPHCRSTMLTDG